ncbi:MAG: trypsin-like peptidase domain-containing protein [Clostridia bacterium]|nr:trypsin-like peptidase domain-containing protein [Clostridia bacterium]
MPNEFDENFDSQPSEPVNGSESGEYTQPVQPQYTGQTYPQQQTPYPRPQQYDVYPPYGAGGQGYHPYNSSAPYQPQPPYGGYGNGYPPPYGYGMPNFQPPKNPQEKSRGRRVALWCTASALIVVALAIALFVFTQGVPDKNDIVNEPSGSSKVEPSYDMPSDIAQAPQASANEDGPQIHAAETPALDSEETKTASAVYNKASKSIVCITSYSAGGDYTLDASGEGSGIILTSDGYIATNSHVVDDSKQTGTLITLYDNTQYLGTIIGIDVKTDLAVIKIDAEGLQPAEFADSDKLQVGQEVFAIGNPGGSSFSNSLTKGALSALDRILSGSGYVKYIQTDAAINPGNSGGALINEHGQVIGINTAKLVATDYEAMGFAIPSNTVLEIINKLIRYGYVNDRGTLSIEGKTCTLYMSKANQVPQGMMITKINSDSPMKNTQAQKDDIITEVNGKTITSSVEFIDELKNYKPGDSVELTLYRSAKSGGYSFKVTVVLKPDTGSN